MWLLGHGIDPFVTVRGLHAFGDHFQPGLILLAPLGAAGTGAAGLLVAQSAFLAAPAPLLYAVARGRGAPAPLAAGVAALWLCSPLTAAANRFDFHPETLVPALVVAGWLALDRGRPALFWVTAVVAMSLKEDVSLLYAAWGALALAERRVAVGAPLLGVAVAWFVLASRVGIPAFDGDAHLYLSRYARYGDSLPSIIGGVVTDPLGWTHEGLARKAGMVGALIASTGALCLLAPRVLLLAAPALAANLLSGFPPQWWLVSHYHVIPAGVAALAAAVGARRAAEWWRRRTGADQTPTRVPAVAIGVLALAFVAVGPIPDLLRGEYGDDPPRGPAAPKSVAVGLVPEGTDVAAQFDLVPHLAQRRRVYTLPEPFIAVPGQRGSWTADDLVARAATVRWVLLDTGPTEPGTPEQIAALGPLLERAGFHEVYARDGVRVLTR